MLRLLSSPRRSKLKKRLKPRRRLKRKQPKRQREGIMKRWNKLSKRWRSKRREIGLRERRKMLSMLSKEILEI